MHRFGRTAQQKMKDRWGGSFILATILALVGAWIAGQYLGTWFSGTPGTAKDTKPGTAAQQGKGGTVGTAAVDPQQFQLYMVQAGAFRSEASAKNFASQLNEQNYTAMVGPRTAAGFFPVVAGIYTSRQAADSTKAKLVAEGAVNGPFVQQVMVDYNPDAVPATTGSTKATDLKKGMDTLNTYLHEVALWMEYQTTGQAASTANIKSNGAALGAMALSLNAETNAKVKDFATMANKASQNAAGIEAAMATGAAPDALQTAMSGYLSLLEQYRSFQAAK